MVVVLDDGGGDDDFHDCSLSGLNG
jgi:hypothetical protein